MGDVFESMKMNRAAAEPIAERLKRYEKYFSVDVDHLKSMVRDYVAEMQNGIELHKNAPLSAWDPKKCSLMMLDSCVNVLPSGLEKGVFYGLDFGGTNYRAVRVALKGHGEYESVEESRKNTEAVLASGKGLMHPEATATEMFDFFATTLRTLMEKHHDLDHIDKAPLSPLSPSAAKPAAGFTFSFACEQKSLKNATLRSWSKGFETGRKTRDPVEGADVRELMDMSLSRNRIDVRVAAVMNDTVGTLLSCAYTLNYQKYPPCRAAVILGTGVNACYVERASSEYGYKGSVINIECANFNKGLPQTNIDHEVDFAAKSSRGQQRLEKMLSGAYLGEICRRTFIKIAQHKAPESAWVPYSLQAHHCSPLLEDTTPNHIIAQNCIRRVFDNPTPDPELAAVLHSVVNFVFERSASLAAMVIAGTSRSTGFLQHAMGGLTVAIDGSLFRKIPFYRRRVRHYLDAILGSDVAHLIHLEVADDGSGKGAAILAATLTTSGL